MTTLVSTARIHPGSPPDSPWWRSAVIYQIYPRSWADLDGDGVGDLPGITTRLPYLRDLGVDAVWLSPFYTSPQADAGYDVADYRDVDPLFGTMADADALLAAAHDLGLKVMVDLVPNHSSDEHAWFRAALNAAPGSRERERYVFRDGRGPKGDLPPNNWQCVFGGSAWRRVTSDDGQWYLHLFDDKQPDFNWDNPEVRAEFEDVLRFWLDRGVDGFRVDVANALVKEAGLPDWGEKLHILDDPDDVPSKSLGRRAPMWDQDGVHQIYRAWRRILNSYNPIHTDGYSGDNDRILCGEAWVDSPERIVRYVRKDEMHQAFNFEFLKTQWRAVDLRKDITSSLTHSRLGWRAHHLGAVKPRRRAPCIPTRTSCGNQAPQRYWYRRPTAGRRSRTSTSAGSHRHHARSAGIGLPLPGRRAGPA